MVNLSFRVDPRTIHVPDGTGTELEKLAHKGFYPTFRMSERQRTIFQWLGNLLDEIDEK